MRGRLTISSDSPATLAVPSLKKELEMGSGLKCAQIRRYIDILIDLCVCVFTLCFLKESGNRK